MKNYLFSFLKKLKSFIYVVKRLPILRILVFLFCIPFVFLFSKETGEGLVTLTFDDGTLCHYETVLPLLEEYQILATFYISSGFLDTPGYLSKNQVVEMFEKGHEIASHGVSHRNLLTLTSAEIENELLESKLTLESLLKSPISNFAPAYGASHWHLNSLIKKYYQSSRSTMPSLNSRTETHPFPLKSFVVLDSTPIAQIEKWMDQAYSQKKWLILVYHYIDPIKGVVHLDAETFESHLKLIQNKKLHSTTLKECLKSR